MDKRISIAIDGPAAAGKSTVAKVVAKQLSYVYIDTGAMYRTLTYAALEQNIDIENEEKLMEVLQSIRIEFQQGKDTQQVFLNGQDVSEVIRTPDVTNRVSIVAKHRLVREEMVRRQQELAAQGGVVMDGRDIGTHVLPNAEVKIFMLASVEERAERRHLENMRKGFSSNLEQLKKEIAQRDKLDSEREVSPLKKAEDAFELDTTSLSIEEVVRNIMAIVSEALQK
ncbi:(d)CMP kinase [Bacillus cytotoxicus]|uniref:Cytidylate kinase n=2 Tax=Bacillus cytotoxicus TaxID=580165 RepID=KCY_BACCN|nr:MULTISPECIES: (d)CMP kinase [Bacillus cereus group]A7GN34.1 RecName: Full=Cytidylate kinase; Short=CK; AltName: Full=Cytidine monophosphate kinase; Short=CMP kinase [Bacillus cytotoxicus NVH 391-98]ABS21542.1 cytidylate kinase [Bacillus cytotoxicus NVH 391-98]AWC30805.1 cytidylate kinase [Bacillus cytotoxicus]AWC34863.1 cytidylate kinase [Bacillus cytotoxicus]AWC38861.1 cytidylate kinase [Bacillus cytotoxicus]AWC42949.1 cytidylate kinase [Bacillus cytotoxicus]